MGDGSEGIEALVENSPVKIKENLLDKIYWFTLDSIFVGPLDTKTQEDACASHGFPKSSLMFGNMAYGTIKNAGYVYGAVFANDKIQADVVPEAITLFVILNVSAHAANTVYRLTKWKETGRPQQTFSSLWATPLAFYARFMRSKGHAPYDPVLHACAFATSRSTYLKNRLKLT